MQAAELVRIISVAPTTTRNTPRSNTIAEASSNLPTTGQFM
jgi:hypothetical protein